jgi:hypothetical protein
MEGGKEQGGYPGFCAFSPQLHQQRAFAGLLQLIEMVAQGRPCIPYLWPPYRIGRMDMPQRHIVKAVKYLIVNLPHAAHHGF